MANINQDIVNFATSQTLKMIQFEYDRDMIKIISAILTCAFVASSIYLSGECVYSFWNMFKIFVWMMISILFPFAGISIGLSGFILNLIKSTSC
jgi:hypothetical protein